MVAPSRDYKTLIHAFVCKKRKRAGNAKRQNSRFFPQNQFFKAPAWDFREKRANLHASEACKVREKDKTYCFCLSPVSHFVLTLAPGLWFARSRIFDLHKNYRLFCFVFFFGFSAAG